VRLTILAVGRLRPHFRAACDDYLGRLARYLDVDECEVKEAGRAGSPAEARRVEAERLRARLPAGATVVALDRDGKAFTSEELASEVERWRRAARPVACLLGGSTGLDPSLIRGAAVRWSLGPITLPHELARVVAAEQLYRACTILRGERYHK
jgi:23S rRNA (pseudouridine1915-N3)-methyltransferase